MDLTFTAEYAFLYIGSPLPLTSLEAHVATALLPVRLSSQATPIGSLKELLVLLGIGVIPKARAERFKKQYRRKTLLRGLFMEWQGRVNLGLTLLCLTLLPLMVWGGEKLPDTTTGRITLVGLFPVSLVTLVLLAALVSCLRDYFKYSQWITNSTSVADLPHVYGAPRQVVADARSIKVARPDVTFSIETFMVDPLLWVQVGDECYCLAQWE